MTGGAPAAFALRAVTAADREPVIALWRSVFPEYADPDRPQRDPAASFERKLAVADGLFWLAHDATEVVGSAMAGYDGHRGWLYSVGVHPRARGAGLGRALVQHAERALLARGCPKVNVQVLTARPEAQRFWTAMGYREDFVTSLGKRLGA